MQQARELMGQIEMVWFAALIIVVLTSPLWLPLLAAAAVAAFAVVVAIGILAVPSIIGANMAKEFGGTQEQGLMFGLAVSLIGFIWFFQDRGSKITPVKSTPPLAAASPPRLAGLEDLQQTIADEKQARLEAAEEAARIAAEEAAAEHRQRLLDEDLWRRIEPLVLAAIGAVDAVLSSSGLPTFQPHTTTRVQSNSAQWFDAVHGYRNGVVMPESFGREWRLAVIDYEAMRISICDGNLRAQIGDVYEEWEALKTDTKIIADGISRLIKDPIGEYVRGA